MIGLGTYSFFWQWHSSAPSPIGWQAMLDKTRDLGCSLFQFCDYAPMSEMSAGGAQEVARYADRLGIQLELGTRGLDIDHITHFIELCQAAGAPLLRSMVKADEIERAPALINALLPLLEQSKVRLSLETYEQIRVSALVDLVSSADSEYVGICLDPANSVAALDSPDYTVPACAPYVNNIHVKDFEFTRRDGWIGFTYAGALLGEGLLDYDAMITAVQPHTRGVNQIVEHWLVWQGDSATTCALEDAWTQHSLEYLHNYEKGNQS